MAQTIKSNGYHSWRSEYEIITPYLGLIKIWELVQFMSKAITNQSERSALEKAIRENAPLLIAKQLDSGRKLRDQDLFHAINGQTEALKFLLDKGLDPNVVDDSGNTLLFYVTDVKVFELILSRIEDINYQNSGGDTILHHLLRKFFEHKSVSLIDLCLSKKPNLSLRNKDGRTVLLSMPIQNSDLAQTANDLEFIFSPSYFTIIDRLLTTGSSLSEADTEGNTLLHYMCQAMRVDRDLQAAVEAMVKRGASINTKNNQGVNILAQLLIRIEIEQSISTGSFSGESVNSGDDEIGSIATEITDEEHENENL